jgi:transcriptional regulator with GAF, ATPase, and Fis domain
MGTISEDITGSAGQHGAGLRGGLAGQLSELARALQNGCDFEATLATMVHAAVDLIPGAAAASIAVAQKHRTITSHAPSSDLPQEVDTLQEKYGQGPCLDAAYQDRVVRVADLRHEPRWPVFAPAAAEAGAKSMLWFQLWIEADNLGALNVYGAQAHAFDAESEEIGLLVAAHAAVAFAEAKKISGLQESVATRDLIGQAKGILMERFKITAQQAFLILTTASSRTNLKLREVAQQLTTTGALPDTQR